jgi:hypothetical protein
MDVLSVQLNVGALILDNSKSGKNLLANNNRFPLHSSLKSFVLRIREISILNGDNQH